MTLTSAPANPQVLARALANPDDLMILTGGDLASRAQEVLDAVPSTDRVFAVSSGTLSSIALERDTMMQVTSPTSGVADALRNAFRMRVDRVLYAGPLSAATVEALVRFWETGHGVVVLPADYTIEGASGDVLSWADPADTALLYLPDFSLEDTISTISFPRGGMENLGAVQVGLSVAEINSAVLQPTLPDRSALGLSEALAKMYFQRSLDPIKARTATTLWRSYPNSIVALQEGLSAATSFAEAEAEAVIKLYPSFRGRFSDLLEAAVLVNR